MVKFIDLHRRFTTTEEKLKKKLQKTVIIKLH